MKYKPGDTFVKEVRGIEYLMQVQETGRAKAIKRITPYVNKNKANTRSTIPESKKPTISKQMPKSNPDELPNILKLRGSQKIYIAEHTREIDTVIRRDHRTFVVKHKKTA
jgi:hypothetical protein